MIIKNKATTFVVKSGISFFIMEYKVHIEPFTKLINTIGKLMYLQSFSLITIGIWPSVEKYVEMERNEATEPVTNAGIALLKKNSAIETRMKHAIICYLVLLTDR